MGVNSTDQQRNLTPQQPLTPQQQRLGMLQRAAITPYQGTAQGGGAAQGTAQLAAALMARQREKALLAGNPAGTQAPSPLAQRTALNPNGAGGMQGPVPLPNPQQQPNMMQPQPWGAAVPGPGAVQAMPVTPQQ